MSLSPVCVSCQARRTKGAHDHRSILARRRRRRSRCRPITAFSAVLPDLGSTLSCTSRSLASKTVHNRATLPSRYSWKSLLANATRRSVAGRPGGSRRPRPVALAVHRRSLFELVEHPRADPLVAGPQGGGRDPAIGVRLVGARHEPGHELVEHHPVRYPPPVTAQRMGVGPCRDQGLELDPQRVDENAGTAGTRLLRQ